jgi:hypothetical protein
MVRRSNAEKAVPALMLPNGVSRETGRGCGLWDPEQLPPCSSFPEGDLGEVMLPLDDAVPRKRAERASEVLALATVSAGSG